MRKLTIILLGMILLFQIFHPSNSSAATANRLGGQDRFDVSINISKKGWAGGSNTVIVANYLAFADALAASPLAYQQNAPILLTHPDKLTPKSETEISRLKAKKVIIVGGFGSVSDNVTKRLNAIGINDIERIDGKDRFEVSQNIAARLNSNIALLANGLVFSDALAIAPYAAKNGHPILLTRKDELPAPTKTSLRKNTIVIGGEGSVGKRVYDQLPGRSRIGGKDRYEVAANIIRTLNLPAEKAFVATGYTFADALTGSVLAAKENAPMLLVSSSLPDSIRKIIQEKKISDFTILGGVGSVSNQTVAQLTNDKPLAGKKIMLDAGHGGSDPGAIGNGYQEKKLNLDFTLKIANQLKQLGANVILTRTSDVYLSLDQRAQLANKQSVDLFISIHHDASNNPSAKGLSTFYSTYRPDLDKKDVYIVYQGKKYEWVSEDTVKRVFYYKDNGVIKSASYVSDNAAMAYDTVSPSAAAVKSRDFAPKLAKALVIPGIASRGTFDQNLYVTRKTNVPSVLLEAGFISNSSEMKLLTNPSIQEDRAKKVAEAIREYFKS